VKKKSDRQYFIDINVEVQKHLTIGQVAAAWTILDELYSHASGPEMSALQRVFDGLADFDNLVRTKLYYGGKRPPKDF
jgi:hypothetical protein